MKSLIHTASSYALIDLHLHLDGSLSLDSVKELARMQKITIPDSDSELLERLQVSSDCKDLNEYLEKFAFPCSLLQSKEAVRMAVYRLKEELRAQGLIYAEIRFAPQLHRQGGLTQSEAVQAAVEGQEMSALKSNLILCCMRGEALYEANLETIETAARYRGKGVCAVDLAGAEALYPTEYFGRLFQLASEKGLPFTIHAGEADGPASVYAALKLGAGRIGHGVRSVEDKALLKMLAERGVTLELCPTSNLNTNIYKGIEEYPIRRLMEAGVKVTVNTDNMTVSGTDLQTELQKVIDAFSFTEEEIRTLLQNAGEASFADEETKRWLSEEIKKRFL